MRIAILTRPLFGLSAVEVALALARNLTASVAWATIVDADELSQVVPGLATAVQLVSASEISAATVTDTQPMLVDCSAYSQNDGGKTFLEGFGSLDQFQNLISGTQVTAIIPHDQREQPLLGLPGLAARLGYERNTDRADVLTMDTQLGNWLQELAVQDAPGLGACGGLPAVFAAAGCPITSAVDWCVQQQNADNLLDQADLIVVLAQRFDFGYHGGPAVSWTLDRAAAPVVVAAAGADMSRREARNLGIEEVWNIFEPTPPGLADLGQRISRVWTDVAKLDR